MAGVVTYKNRGGWLAIGYDMDATSYHKEGTGWNQQANTGYTLLLAGSVIGIASVDGVATSTPPTKMLVGHTSNDTQIDLTFSEGFKGVSVDETLPGSSTIWYLVSFDQRATFSAWISTAWVQVVRQNGGTWEYRDGGAVWQTATTNSLLGALRQSYGISANQMTGSEMSALSQANWTSAGGVTIKLTPSLDFAFAFTADGDNVPVLTGISATISDDGSQVCEGYSGGEWTDGAGWTDGTAVSGIPLAQSGAISYDGTTFTGDYHVLSGVPGFWLRVKTRGTSAGTSISSVRYKAPCQPLQNIGNGVSDTLLSFLVWDDSEQLILDYTSLVGDNVLTELSKADIPLSTSDFIYVAGLLPYNTLEVTPYSENNKVATTLSGEYWDGEAWAALDITDGTAGSAGKPFSQEGQISWSAPENWRQHIPYEAEMPRGYWTRWSVADALTSTAALSEVRLYQIPEVIKKHKIACTLQDRLVILNRPDAPDQVDVSRALEEYGFSGSDSWASRVGGLSGIQAAVEAWNAVYIAKLNNWYRLDGDTVTNLQISGLQELRDHTPVHSRSIVLATAPTQSGEQAAMFFLNHSGAYRATGLQSSGSYGTGRLECLSATVNWWDGRHIDLESLHVCYGAYLPERRWVIWAVPWQDPSGTQQATCNRLLVYDLLLGQWLPPFDLAVASMCLGYAFSADAPAGLGSVGLYAGDHEGQIFHLFGPGVRDDNDLMIDAFAETGWLDLGAPGQEKILRWVRIFGITDGDAITVSLYVDGSATAAVVRSETAAVAVGDEMFRIVFNSENLTGELFKLRIDTEDRTEIYAIHLEWAHVRAHEGQGVS